MRTWKQLEPAEQIFQNGVVTVGNFDGLHLGHQTLLNKAMEFNSPRVIITFDPHPIQVLRPERSLKRLFPREDLAERLPDYETDLLVVLKFDESFARIEARTFLEEYILKPFRPKNIVAGYDFTFGRGREGTLDVLEKWTQANGIALSILQPLRIAGEVVSSRRIRDLIQRGDVHGAHLLLGRPFYLRGVVGEGAGRGVKLGFPTLNQIPINETLPPTGVYASRTRCEGSTYFSVTNVGTNPTFESGPQIKVETHVLGTQVDWRGKSVDVEFIERLREEKKFSGIEDLKKQIQSDILKAKAILEKVK